jgi:Flp pilus assembly protein TadG
MVMAVGIPIVMGLLALSVDTAVLGVAKSQLQSVADSAALAGANALATQSRLQMGVIQTSDITNAQNQAIQFANYNKVLGDGAVLLSNWTNTNTGTEDLVVGYMARPLNPTPALATAPAGGPYMSPDLQTTSAMIPNYNTIVVQASRTATHTGKVPSFFSKIWGNGGSDLHVASAAAVLGISGFSSSNGGGTTNANLFPITLDKTTYAMMLQGQTTDSYTFTPGNYTYPLAVGAPNGVTNGADGKTESRLYPVGAGYPGNWGTIKIGVSDNSTATISAQIRYGITPAQLATYPGGVIQPDPTTGTIQFEGNPGISAGVKDDLTSIIGKPIRIPIYDPAQTGGNGNNLIYTIIAFAPVRILKVNFQGKYKYVIIQPAGVPDDPTQIWGGLVNGPLPQQYRIVLIR